jgi:tetratricopeptide (TPR) repeat protein
MTAKKITIDGFLDLFKSRHDNMEDRPFCWVLGSGASVQSNIPTGSTLVKQWLGELHKQEDFEKGPIEKWATSERLEIPRFEYSRAANFYPWVYHRRFRDYKEEGYAFLEKAMEKAEPSFGYSVLAQIMATTQHKIAITTNFDNLVADALSIYTKTFPLVCGHESLTGYIRANLRRPLVAKIHRDLLLAPLSNPEEIAKLPNEWATALKKILDRYTPIVIGYGGNDGSLMGFLNELPPIEGGILWCYRDGDDVDDKVHKIVQRHLGRLVPIAGFDEVMLQLQEKLQLPFLLPQLQRASDERVAAYQKQFEALTAALSKPAANAAAEVAREPARKAAAAAVERLTTEKDWWAWQLKANAESDPAKKESIYRAALEEFPKSAELTGNFALFMDMVRRDYDEAERLHRKALDLDRSNANNTGNFAIFLKNARKDYDEAERLYRKALDLDPSNAKHTGNFAIFMSDVRKDHDEAERLYRRALDLDPSNATTTGNFAIFMSDKRKDYDEAERLYRKALELEPHSAVTVRKLAVFLKNVRKDYDEAERLYRRALELDPNDAIVTGDFALFMHQVRKDYNEAGRLYQKALDLDATDGNRACNYAQFLGARNRIEEAKGYAERAWELLNSEPSQTHAEIAFTRWLLDRASGLDGLSGLGRLRTLLNGGFNRSEWTFDQLLATLVPQLPKGERALAQKLADAILDETKVSALDSEPLWKKVEPIPLTAPWPE